MIKFKKFIVCLVIALIAISSVVYATETYSVTLTQDNVADSNAINLISTADTAMANASATTIDEDLYVYRTDSYSLNDIVNGNVFSSTTKFVVNPRSNGGIINGNLFAIAGEEVAIESDVVYSNNKDANGNYLIDSINSKSKINGNVYVLTDMFTLETGSEIMGDLYVAANNVVIEQNAVIHGNAYIVCENLTLSGQIQSSAYIGTKNITMNYFGYIYQDLFLNASTATLDGVIYRNAFISVSGNLTTENDFKVNKNLTVNYANSFTMSGKVNGDAKFNVNNLNIKSDNENICIIRGNLSYATKNDYTIPEGIVTGEISKGEFKEISNNRSIKTVGSYMFTFVVFLVFVLGIVFISKKFAPNAIAKLPEINVNDTLKSFGIGFASMFIIVLGFIVLAITGVGIYIAFFALLVYMVILGLALPLILNKISELLKWNLNSYVKLLIITAIFYILRLIPVLGGLITFILLTSGIGNILLGIFKKKD